MRYYRSVINIRDISGNAGIHSTGNFQRFEKHFFAHSSDRMNLLPRRSANRCSTERETQRTPVNLNSARAKRMRKLVNRYPFCNIPYLPENSFPLGLPHRSRPRFTRIPSTTRRTPDTVLSPHDPAKVQAAYIIYTISRGVCRVRQNMNGASADTVVRTRTPRCRTVK